MEVHCALMFCGLLFVVVVMAIALRAAVSYFNPDFTIPQPLQIIFGCIVILLLVAAFLNCFSGGEVFHWRAS